MTEQFDLVALEKALSVKERGKKKVEGERKEPKTKKTNPGKPLLVPVDEKGKEVEPKDMKVGKTYGLKQNG